MALSRLVKGFGCENGLVSLGDELLKEYSHPKPYMVADCPTTVLHRHGVNVEPRTGTSETAVDALTSELILPKTFLTRRGAIVLFADDPLISDTDRELLLSDRRAVDERYRFMAQKMHGNLKHLVSSVLTFGGRRNEDETCLRFLQNDRQDVKVTDPSTKPGGNIWDYLSNLRKHVADQQPPRQIAAPTPRQDGDDSTDYSDLSESELDEESSESESTEASSSAQEGGVKVGVRLHATPSNSNIVLSAATDSTAEESQTSSAAAAELIDRPVSDATSAERSMSRSLSQSNVPFGLIKAVPEGQLPPLEVLPDNERRPTYDFSAYPVPLFYNAMMSEIGDDLFLVPSDGRPPTAASRWAPTDDHRLPTVYTGVGGEQTATPRQQRAVSGLTVVRQGAVPSLQWQTQYGRIAKGPTTARKQMPIDYLHGFGLGGEGGVQRDAAGTPLPADAATAKTSTLDLPEVHGISIRRQAAAEDEGVGGVSWVRAHGVGSTARGRLLLPPPEPPLVVKTSVDDAELEEQKEVEGGAPEEEAETRKTVEEATESASSPVGTRRPIQDKTIATAGGKSKRGQLSIGSAHKPAKRPPSRQQQQQQQQPEADATPVKRHPGPPDTAQSAFSAPPIIVIRRLSHDDGEQSARATPKPSDGPRPASLPEARSPATGRREWLGSRQTPTLTSKGSRSGRSSARLAEQERSESRAGGKGRQQSERVVSQPIEGPGTLLPDDAQGPFARSKSTSRYPPGSRMHRLDSPVPPPDKRISPDQVSLELSTAATGRQTPRPRTTPRQASRPGSGAGTDEQELSPSGRSPGGGRRVGFPSDLTSAERPAKTTADVVGDFFNELAGLRSRSSVKRGRLRGRSRAASASSSAASPRSISQPTSGRRDVDAQFPGAGLSPFQFSASGGLRPLSAATGSAGLVDGDSLSWNEKRIMLVYRPQSAPSSGGSGSATDVIDSAQMESNSHFFTTDNMMQYKPLSPTQMMMMQKPRSAEGAQLFMSLDSSTDAMMPFPMSVTGHDVMSTLEPRKAKRKISVSKRTGLTAAEKKSKRRPGEHHRTKKAAAAGTMVAEGAHKTPAATGEATDVTAAEAEEAAATAAIEGRAATRLKIKIMKTASTEPRVRVAGRRSGDQQLHLTSKHPHHAQQQPLTVTVTEDDMIDVDKKLELELMRLEMDRLAKEEEDQKTEEDALQREDMESGAREASLERLQARREARERRQAELAAKKRQMIIERDERYRQARQERIRAEQTRLGAERKIEEERTEIQKIQEAERLLALAAMEENDLLSEVEKLNRSTRLPSILQMELDILDDNPLDDFETVRQRIEEEVHRQEAARRMSLAAALRKELLHQMQFEELRKKKIARIQELKLQRVKLETDRQMAIERHHAMLLQRREDNIENMVHLEVLRRDQETLTRPWVFSYYIVWPRESYRIYARSPITAVKEKNKKRQK